MYIPGKLSPQTSHALSPTIFLLLLVHKNSVSNTLTMAKNLIFKPISQCELSLQVQTLAPGAMVATANWQVMVNDAMHGITLLSRNDTLGDI